MVPGIEIQPPLFTLRLHYLPFISKTLEPQVYEAAIFSICINLLCTVYVLTSSKWEIRHLCPQGRCGGLKAVCGFMDSAGTWGACVCVIPHEGRCLTVSCSSWLPAFAQEIGPAITSSGSLLTKMATSHWIPSTSPTPSWIPKPNRAPSGLMEESRAVITAKTILKRILRDCTSDGIQTWNLG